MANQHRFSVEKDFRELPLREVRLFLDEHHYSKDKFTETPVTRKELDIHSTGWDNKTKKFVFEARDANGTLVTMESPEAKGDFGRAVSYNAKQASIEVNAPHHLLMSDEGRWLGIYREKNPQDRAIPIRVVEYSEKFARVLAL